MKLSAIIFILCIAFNIIKGSQEVLMRTTKKPILSTNAVIDKMCKHKVKQFHNGPKVDFLKSSKFDFNGLRG